MTSSELLCAMFSVALSVVKCCRNNSKIMQNAEMKHENCGVTAWSVGGGCGVAGALWEETFACAQVYSFLYRMKLKPWKSCTCLCGVEKHEMDPCHCKGSCSPVQLAGGLGPWAQGLGGVVKRCNIAHPSANPGTWGPCPLGLLYG